MLTITCQFKYLKRLISKKPNVYKKINANVTKYYEVICLFSDLILSVPKDRFGSFLRYILQVSTTLMTFLCYILQVSTTLMTFLRYILQVSTTLMTFLLSKSCSHILYPTKLKF